MHDPDKAIIFDVQRFSLHDGPGIRTTVFFKGCPLRCIWCQNPESWRAEPEIAFYKQLCRGCFECLAACRENAILQRPDKRIDDARCTGCGACADVCVKTALRVVGRIWTVAELVDEIVKDCDYFKESGGGVTLSGGEPMQQTRFLRTLLPELKRRHIHIAMETCGHFSWERMEHLLPFLDLIYFDLKAMAHDSHHAFTGCSNERILKNFEKLSGRFGNLQARMPVIPGKNDGRTNILATARFLLENGKDSIRLLPYHNLGEAKISRLNTEQKPLGIPPRTARDRDRVKTLFEANGVKATIDK
ncbi:glycyl-radical enzyme activating protein [uncultured Desulfosarcina sp.]|uniref:glycyl-radical enzyme activating protein n=1 Tax=uncultured Desulfosarcina sp. TaxID=218289 RepID=UPI002D1E3E0B|nr:glycyl-radical enzyme activating protein [uncultured Desulfosarcina sp.]